MCARCFRATNHQNHTVTFYIAQQSGGCCDCGDVEAWRYPIGCPLHAFLKDDSDQDWPPQERSSAAIPPVRNPRESPSRQGIPEELWESMSRTIAYATEYVINTLEFASEDASVPATEQELKDQVTADPNHKDIFATIVWNDEKHSFEEVSRHLCDTVGRTSEESTTIVDTIDEQGREVVDISPFGARVLDVAQAIAKIDIGVTVRRAYDTFREQLSDVIIEWLLDLSKSRVGSDSLLLREVIAAELFTSRKGEANVVAGQVAPDQGSFSDIKSPSRLDWLFILHSRLWKGPRLRLKELYVSVLTLSSLHRLTVGMKLFLRV